jgi:hypothetical protein
MVINTTRKRQGKYPAYLMETRNVYEILVRKLEGKMPHRTDMRRLEKNIKYVGHKFWGLI